jgi:hypothetical protein
VEREWWKERGERMMEIESSGGEKAVEREWWRESGRESGGKREERE